MAERETSRPPATRNARHRNRRLDNASRVGYSVRVRARKIVAVLLASSYLASVAARLACAETMGDEARPAAASHAVEAADDPCCHHASAPAKSSRQDHPLAPCCRTGSSDLALVNPAVVAPSERRVLVLGEIAANAAPALQIARQDFASDPDPPGSLGPSQVLSSLSPRAPPSLLVVL